MSKNTHGGRRPGAGRPREADPLAFRVVVQFRKGELEALDAARGNVSRAAAIRQLTLQAIGASATDGKGGK